LCDENLRRSSTLLTTHSRLFPIVLHLLRNFLHSTGEFCRRMDFKIRSIKRLSHILNHIGKLTAQQPGWHVLEIEELRALPSARWEKLLRRLIEKACVRAKDNHRVRRFGVSDLLIG